LDDTLAVRAANGDAQSFGALYDRYAVRVASLLRSFAWDPSHLEDLVHDTFCRAMDALPRYETKGKFRSWLFSIALNVGRKDAKRQAKAVPVGSLESYATPADDSADSATLDRERARLAEAMLRSLPERERLVVVMRIWLEMGYEEIGALLGIPSGTARRRMHTALKGLRDAFGRTQQEKDDAAARGASDRRSTAVGS
jgi:RNA polymerase sigma-70 factor (ECF subfamily)